MAAICTDAFVPLARNIAAARGIPSLPIVVIPHPIADISPAEVIARAVDAFPDIIAAITEPAAKLVERAASLGWDAERGALGGRHDGYLPTAVSSYEDLLAVFEESGWSDGLPIVPPTKQRVAAMLEAHPVDPETILGPVPPYWGLATIEKIAVNAVMAGCRPQYLPVVVAAVRAMLQERFNLLALQTTTHPAAPLVLVNGPIRHNLKLNSGANCFGQGNRANATIGRAVRLVLQNIGGARPGLEDRATHGQPSKYGYCMAENEEANPWGSLHVERGFAAETSTVTVIAGESPHNVNDHSSTTAKGILTTAADTMATMGANDPYIGFGRHQPLLVLGPEHAATIARDGWSKDDIRRFLFENARKPLSRLKLGGMYAIRDWPKWVEPVDQATMVPIVERPEDFLIVVAGGEGKHSCYIPTLGVNHAVTVAIDES